MMTRWYTPAEALKMATADNAALLALSGFINPYPGRLGVVEEGAFADLLLVDGDPLEDLDLVADPDRNFLVIMKDGSRPQEQHPPVSGVVDSPRSAQTGASVREGTMRHRRQGGPRPGDRPGKGVCYRAWARSEAEAIGVTGWVRNERDGSVTALIAGPKGKVSRMVDALWEGPAAASVNYVATEGNGPARAPGGLHHRPGAVARCRSAPLDPTRAPAARGVSRQRFALCNEPGSTI